MWTSESMTMAEALVTSGMGFLIVFCVLGMLAIIILIFSRLFSGMAAGKSVQAAPQAAAPVETEDASEAVAIVTSVICEELNADPSELHISDIHEV